MLKQYKREPAQQVASDRQATGCAHRIGDF